ncbi:S-layer homology domain-containing protein, partial [Oceanobacillus massiliensis]|uniref:S-layer homology domain-containing protein n=1 Tax=Oceanobacillus massiliensis TaxID=1465765 RepID=UPI00301ADB42
MILKKRTIISLITTSLLLTPALTSASELEEAYDYGDIDETSSHYEGVQWVSQFGIQGYPIEGTNDRKYGVGEDLSRKHASKFFTLVSGLEVPNSSLVETYFKDVSAEHPYASYIGAVAAKGIFGGDNGIFNPEDIMKRQHMAKTIVESYGLKNTGEEIDVNLDNIHESYHEYITILAQHGITTELEDFRPGEAVTRTQFATFLYRANQAVEGLPTETPEPTEPENPEQPVEEFEKLQLDFPFDLAVNQEEKITFYGIEEDGSKKDITSLATFKVADQTVVTIEDGLIHAVSKGSTEVTAIYKDYQTIVNVTVADIEQPTDPVIPDQADSEGIERIEVYSAGRVAVNQTAPVHLGAYYEGNNVVDISSLATVEIENPEVLAYEHGLLRGISLGTTE